MRKLVLFDIDGTILWTDGAGRRAIRRALLDQMGTAGPIESYRLDGKTDPQIVRELMVAAGHPQAEDPGQIEAVCRRYVALLHQELTASTVVSKVLPGVLELLNRLDRQADVLIGLLTGNVAEGAALKLQSVGIAPGRFRVGAFGSDAADRAALPRVASDRAVPFMGRAPEGADLVIIGDTPADVACGRALSARAIGVGTGSYSRDQLLEAGAFAAFDSLAETDQVLAAIHA